MEAVLNDAERELNYAFFRDLLSRPVANTNTTIADQFEETCVKQPGQNLVCR